MRVFRTAESRFVHGSADTYNDGIPNRIPRDDSRSWDTSASTPSQAKGEAPEPATDTVGWFSSVEAVQPTLHPTLHNRLDNPKIAKKNILGELSARCIARSG